MSPASTLAVSLCILGGRGAAELSPVSRAFEKRLLPWLQAGIAEADLADQQAPLAETFELRSGIFGQTLFAKRRFERGDDVALVRARIPEPLAVVRKWWVCV
jgi:hypothetical protein